MTRPAGVAGYYDDFWTAGQERRYEPDDGLRRLIAGAAGPGVRCVDVGCGTGNSYAVELHRSGVAYTGFDVSREAVAAVRRAGMDAEVIADASQLPVPDLSVDLVLCIEVLEHLFAPADAAREILRVLRPGGRLIASTPNVAYWRMRVNLLAGLWNPLGDELSLEQPWRDPHVRFFTPDTLARMLRSAGFSDVTTTAGNGRFLDHLTSRPTAFGQSALYRRLQDRLPSLLGLTIHAGATR